LISLFSWKSTEGVLAYILFGFISLYSGPMQKQQQMHWRLASMSLGRFFPFFAVLR